MCAAEHAGTLRDIRRLPPDHPQEGPTHTCVTGHKASGLGGPHGSSHELRSWQIHKERGGEQVREVLSAQVCGTSATSLPISQGKLRGEAASEAAQEVQPGKLRLVRGLPRLVLPTHWMVTTALRASQAPTVYQGLNWVYLNSFALMLSILQGAPYHPYFTDEESSRKLSNWAALKVNSRTSLKPRSF